MGNFLFDLCSDSEVDEDQILSSGKNIERRSNNQGKDEDGLNFLMERAGSEEEKNKSSSSASASSSSSTTASTTMVTLTDKGGVSVPDGCDHKVTVRKSGAKYHYWWSPEGKKFCSKDIGEKWLALSEDERDVSLGKSTQSSSSSSSSPGCNVLQVLQIQDGQSSKKKKFSFYYSFS
jgi:hypothetical protein